MIKKQWIHDEKCIRITNRSITKQEERIKIKIHIFDYLNNGHEVKIAHRGIKQSFSAYIGKGVSSPRTSEISTLCFFRNTIWSWKNI